MLPAIGKISERYGPLSMIFYKEGHFKSNFLYFDKKTPPFPEEEKWKKKCSKQQNVIKYFEKAFFY